MTLLLMRRIRTGFALADDTATAIAKGDLSRRVTFSGSDEIGSLLQLMEDMRQNLHRVISEVQRGSDAIASAATQVAAGTLDLSNRTEQQAGSLEQTASASEELSSTVQHNAENASQAKVAVELHLGEEARMVLLDRKKITQALLNLYLNAIQAMPEGGRLQINAAETPAGLELVVRDSGSGIPADALDRIFDPYYTTKTTGTGLGLAVVQKVVEAHGGRVRVQSDQQGSRFTLILPRTGPGGSA